MTVRTNFDLQILPDGRARFELVAAGTSNRNLLVVWVNASFHRNLFEQLRQNRRQELQRSPRLGIPKLARPSRKSMPKSGPRIICESDGPNKSNNIDIFVHKNCG